MPQLTLTTLYLLALKPIIMPLLIYIILYYSKIPIFGGEGKSRGFDAIDDCIYYSRTKNCVVITLNKILSCVYSCNNDFSVSFYFHFSNLSLYISPHIHIVVLLKDNGLKTHNNDTSLAGDLNAWATIRG